MMPILAKQIDHKNILTKRNKMFIFLFASLTVVTMLSLPNAKAQQTAQQEVIQDVQLNQAELDQILAPIALYPDSLLSQILVASTYPLEVVQATRWRQANSSLAEDQALAAVEDQDWDPSVKALAPFEDLLARLSEDLDWLQSVGDAFLQNENQVLASVQNLRQIAYDNGSIADNDYYQVTSQDDSIIIESTQREIVYVPYYDTRVVYGDWRWAGYAPTYWHRPRNYVHLSGGFYWNSSYYVRPNIFYGGFHWGSRRLVVNHNYYDNYYGYDSYRGGYDRNIPISRYSYWSHNPNHRRGVRYPEKVIKSDPRLNRFGVTSASKTKRNVVTSTNRRTVGASRVQQKLSNTNGTVRNTGTLDRRQSVRPTVSNTRVVNKSTSVNRTATPQRSTATVTTSQRTTPTLRQRAVNQRVTNTSTNRRSSATSPSAAKTYSRPSTRSTSTTSTNTTSTRTKTNTTNNTSLNRSKWNRQ